MRLKLAAETVGEVELIHQRAELATVPTRQRQASGKLERVEHLRTLPVTEPALKNADINVCVVGGQGGGIQCLEHIGFDVAEHRGFSYLLVRDAVDLSGEMGDRLFGFTSQLFGPPTCRL